MISIPLISVQALALVLVLVPGGGWSFGLSGPVGHLGLASSSPTS